MRNLFVLLAVALVLAYVGTEIINNTNQEALKLLGLMMVASPVVPVSFIGLKLS